MISKIKAYPLIIVCTIFLIIFFILLSIYPLNIDLKKNIKKYFFPYKHINNIEIELEKKNILAKNYEQNTILILQNLDLHNMELLYKKSLHDIKTTKASEFTQEKLKITKYNLLGGIYSGIAQNFPGSAYIDFYKNKMLILSARGIFGISENLDNLNFKQIPNNLNDFIGLKQFKKSLWFSFKDIFVHDEKIYISYTDEIKNNCWNISILMAEINFTNLYFEKFFSSDECINSKESLDSQFDGSQSGGRMDAFEDNLFLSIGDFRSRSLAQDLKSINGKVVQISLKNNNFKVISMGHRNPQGLFVKDDKFIFETEHGPEGGDEINIINWSKKDEVPNYGWPVSSYGNHYGGVNDFNKDLYKKYPLHKSHSEYGFSEPLKYFVPSIGISQILGLDKNIYLIGSMANRALFIFKLNNNQEIVKIKRIRIDNRIRDLIKHNDNIYMFLEDTATIGKMSISELISYIETK